MNRYVSPFFFSCLFFIFLQVVPNTGIRLASHHRNSEEMASSLSSHLFVPSMELKTLITSKPRRNNGGGGGGRSGATFEEEEDDDDDEDKTHLLIFPMRDIKAFINFCLSQQVTSNNVTVSSFFFFFFCFSFVVLLIIEK